MLADYLDASRMTFLSMAKDGEIELAEQVRAYHNERCERTDMRHHDIESTAQEVHDAWEKRLTEANERWERREGATKSGQKGLAESSQ